MKLYIYPYKMGSKSAKALAEALNCKRIRTTARIKNTKGKKIINWGNSTTPYGFNFNPGIFINHPENVKEAGNKLATFLYLLPILKDKLPKFTPEKLIADSWLGEGKTVCVRHKLTGHSGEGIEIVEPNQPLPNATLYVEYIPKDAEYRLHVLGGEVKDIQRKKRANGWKDNPNFNPKIRSHQNGWVFCREGVTVPDEVKELAVQAVNGLGLYFGAVDIIKRKGTNQYYLLEVNTAPGLEGKTLEAYVNYFKGLLA